MLYEPPKHLKKIIIIGSAAIVLAVLAIVVIPLFFKDKTLQIPTANLPVTSEQQKIQKDMNEAAKKLQDQSISEQQTKEDMKSVSQEMKKLPNPSLEEMQKVSKELNQSIR